MKRCRLCQHGKSFLARGAVQFVPCLQITTLRYVVIFSEGLPSSQACSRGRQQNRTQRCSCRRLACDMGLSNGTQQAGSIAVACAASAVAMRLMWKHTTASRRARLVPPPRACQGGAFIRTAKPQARTRVLWVLQDKSHLSQVSTRRTRRQHALGQHIAYCTLQQHGQHCCMVEADAPVMLTLCTCWDLNVSAAPQWRHVSMTHAKALLSLC